ncbi:MAG: hypothetical protein WC890_03340 [Candidatus Margulisiibacteriota bacterium]
MKTKHAGFALLSVILLCTLLFIVAGLFAKIVYNYSLGNNGLQQRAQAYYLAEAGIEKGKTEIAENPAWYTDLPNHAEDDTEWLINSAAGQTNSLDSGKFKIIREQGKSILYAVGFQGEGVNVQKIEFAPFPFKEKKWEII